MNEYRVKVSVRNNLILQALEEAGYSGHGALAQFCRENDIDPSQLSSLVAFRVAPITADGEFSRVAKDLMEALGAAPSDLWTAEQLTMKLDRNSAERAVSKEVVRDLLDWRNERLEPPSPEASLQHKETADVVRGVLAGLRGSERNVLAMRFGIGDKPEMTLDEVAELFGVTKERIRQIELQALRKLRHEKNVAVLDKAGLVE